MDEKTIYDQVAETGRLLLEKRLVARTWGNFSARLDETHFVITPSGLGYEQMNADDMVRFCLTDETWEGSRKPSSEKGIHAAAYRLFPEVGFVIHTHQAYATALGLSPPEELALSDEEREALGGVAWAEYGLPGTKKLKNAGLVKKTFDGVKVLANGTLTKKLTVKAAAYSEAAKEKIEAAGGKAEVI